MPVFNEQYFVEQIIDKILNVSLPPEIKRELIIVDDGSSDGTREILKRIAKDYQGVVRLYFHDINRGKGAAIRTAIKHATGDICIIQDADLEYDPKDYEKLIRPILSGEADVVYGSRFLLSDYRRALFFWHSVGNKFLTTLSNMFTNLNLTDMETCYKTAKSNIFKSIPIRSNRFGIEPELTAKFAKRGCRIYEVPISYRGRSYDEGKKINWYDGLKAIWTILYFWIVDDLYEELHGHAILYRLSHTHRFNRWIASTLKDWVGESVLEIGAGIGNLTLKFFPRQSYTVSDIDQIHLDYLKNRFGNLARMNVKKIDIENPDDFNTLEEEFDTVICLNVLEHVNQDLQALKNMYRALSPGGRAIILVPQGHYLYGSLDRSLGHYRRYTRKELIDKCERARFLIEQVYSFNRIGFFPWFVNGRILKRRNFSKLQLKFFDSFVWLWRLIDKLLPFPGLSIIGIAKKPIKYSEV